MSDKKPNERAVTTDALETLGQIHTREEKRDAIHLAVEPVECGEDYLEPGAHITVKGGVARAEHPSRALGIVDPFILDEVRRGQRFWFVMYPRRVHSLRHVWTHPAFDEQPGDTHGHPDQLSPEQGARAWLEEHAKRLGYTYDRLMELATQWTYNEEYVMDNTERYKGVFDAEGFWPRYERVTGKTIDDNLRECFFTCSC